MRSSVTPLSQPSVIRSRLRRDLFAFAPASQKPTRPILTDTGRDILQAAYYRPFNETLRIRSGFVLFARDCSLLKRSHEHHDLPSLVLGHRIRVRGHCATAVANGAVDIAVG